MTDSETKSFPLAGLFFGVALVALIVRRCLAEDAAVAWPRLFASLAGKRSVGRQLRIKSHYCCGYQGLLLEHAYIVDQKSCGKIVTAVDHYVVVLYHIHSVVCSDAFIFLDNLHVRVDRCN